MSDRHAIDIGEINFADGAGSPSPVTAAPPHTRTWQIDPFSSAISFPSWRELGGARFVMPADYQPLLVSSPHTWLLSTGWSRHHPAISILETPGPPPSHPRCSSSSRHRKLRW